MLCYNYFMKPIDLTNVLKKYRSGWIALNSNNKVVAYAKRFDKLSEAVKDEKDINLMPVLKDYSSIIS